jgi:hypothetical protein
METTPVQLTDNQRALINELARIAWELGAVRSPEMGQDIQQLRALVLAKPKQKEEGK